MRLVRIRKDELLVVLKKNREEHVETFNEALEGYKKAVVKSLETILAIAKEGKAYYTSIDIEKPCSYEGEYNSIIRMLELSSDEIIELSETEFKNYVEDSWAWQQNFLMSGVRYSKLARQKAPIYTMGAINPGEFKSASIVKSLME